MGDDDRSRRPNVSRTSSLFAGVRTSGTVPGGYTTGPFSAYENRGGRDPRNPVMSDLDRRIAAAQEQARVNYYQSTHGEDEESRPKDSGRDFYTDFLDDVLRTSKLQGNITRSGTYTPGMTDAEVQSIASPLQIISNNVNPEDKFLFDRGPLINPGSGERTGVLQARGVYGSADSLERQLPAGETVETGTNENYLTIASGILWLRNLAARDPDAYNRLVVLLRNAQYGNLSDEDALLPLSGYTNQVGIAFAEAAADLSQANQGGDNRTLMEYLTGRGQGYSDFLAQQEADRAAEEAFVPTERRYQDPATLRLAAKEAAIDALGRKLTDEEEAQFEAAFRAKEDGFYGSLDAAREGQTMFQGYAPDISGQVSSFLEGPDFEQESHANRLREYQQVFQRMMGVGG